MLEKLLNDKKVQKTIKELMSSDAKTKKLAWAILKLEFEGSDGEVLVDVSNKKSSNVTTKRYWTAVERRLLYKIFNKMFMRGIAFSQAQARELARQFNRTPAAISSQYYIWESNCNLVEV